MNDPPQSVARLTSALEAPATILAHHVRLSGAAEVRLDQAATDAFKTWLPSRASAKKACRQGEVLVDGQPAEPSRWVGPGAALTLLEARTGASAAVFELQLPVLFEDPWMAVVWKPPGYRVSGNLHQTIVRALPYNLTPSPLPDALTCAQPAHRLDASTQGLLVCAKTSRAMVALHRAFAKRTVVKTYTAIVIGDLDSPCTLTTLVDDKPAETRVIPVGRSRSLRTSWITEVTAAPLTGRTHQIRRHLARIGHPIVGDTIYGERHTTLRGMGLFLAAAEVSLPHPNPGHAEGRITVTGEIPAKFRSLQRREARRFATFHGDPTPA